MEVTRPPAQNRHRVPHDFVGDAQLLDRGNDAVEVDAGEFGGSIAEQFLGVADVPVAGFFVQDVPHGGLSAER